MPTPTFFAPAATVFQRAMPVFSVVLLSGLSACGGGGGGGGGAPAPVTVSIGQAEGLGNSPISKVAFPVTLSGPANGTVSVTYTTTDQGAIGGAACTGDATGPDYVTPYVTPTGTFTIATGLTSGALEVTVCHPSAFAGAPALRVMLTGTSANGVLSNTAKTAYGLVSSQSSGKLNDSGVSQCSNGTSLTTCPQANYPGQDGGSGPDAQAWTSADSDGRKGFAFAKLGDAKAVLSASTNAASGWKCVQDNVTGLTWEAKTGAAMDWAAAGAYVGTTNTAALCGYSDWRLPTPQELASLVDHGVTPLVTPVLEQTFFASEPGDSYWTATPVAPDPASAWSVEFAHGVATYINKTTSARVRLVRSTAPTPPQYEAHVADGTVSDHFTGLMWRKCSDGYAGSTCTGAPGSYTWQQALQRVQMVNASPATLGQGYSDWRLPSRNELQSILAYANNNPALTAEFMGTGSHWTSTPYAGDASKSWFVDFTSGTVAFAANSVARYILLVRNSQ